MASASAMNPEKAKCYGKEISAERYNAWKKDFEKYLSDYDSLNESARFDVSRKALKKIVVLTNNFSSESGVRAPVKLVTQSEQLLADLDSGNISPSSAIKVMKSGLIHFEDSMDDMIFRAQAKNPNCKISPYQVYTNGIGPSTGVK